jgi:hypothetical protein
MDALYSCARRQAARVADAGHDYGGYHDGAGETTPTSIDTVEDHEVHLHAPGSLAARAGACTATAGRR